jgi:fused signal recognition particle receptor
MFGFLRRKPSPTGADSPPPTVPIIPESVGEVAPSSWVARLKSGLTKTSHNLAGVFGLRRIDEALFEELETALLLSDAGVEATEALLKDLRVRVKKKGLEQAPQLKAELVELITERLIPLEKLVDVERAKPLVWMIAGVNGAGKTTSIGKLALHLQQAGKTVLLAAGDTFRAAAREQLMVWGERNGVSVISQDGGDPSAVSFDAVNAGKARGIDVVLIDTAGRLPTQLHLMDELRKIKRVLSKAQNDAPHEALLVLDGTTGQNMLAQVKAFNDAIQLTGLIVTKLDGSAKGGAILALAHQHRQNPIPVYFVGVGESLSDLQAFKAADFAAALVSDS